MRIIGAALCGAALAGVPASAQWVDFVDETASRLASGDLLSDPEEKDFAWGDVDRDGDIDVVVVRKQPFTSTGKKRNFLLLNQAGVFVDATDDYAVASDVVGDEGFNTPTNDRDVKLADLDGDGWLDIVTAVTISDGDAKEIGHPRVYRNLGCDGACSGTEDWLGFRHESARIPAMDSWTGQSGFNPRFCSVDAADVDGDGYLDLWFGDYDSSGGGGGATQPPGADYNDRLLLNHGAANPGFFYDATLPPDGHFDGTIALFDVEFPISAFGAAANIADMNGDGFADIVKQTSLNAPTYVGVAYNNPLDEGYFEEFQVVYDLAPYFVSVGDLNNDDRLDLVITDDGADRYVINEGNDEDGQAVLVSYPFSYNHSGPPEMVGDDGFGGNSVIADLNNDGWHDVVITDVDVDEGPCVLNRRTHIYKNLGNVQPGGFVTLEEQTSGTNCVWWSLPTSDCLVTGIPSDKLLGTHDVAIFDINGDGWNDMIIGRCNSTEIWINVPPVVPVGAVPDGNGVPGQGLTIDKAAGQEISLAWGASCNASDSDYAVYEGTLDGAFDDHAGKVCSTGGVESSLLTPDTASSYYLIVPHGGGYEGGYGFASDGTPRQPGGSVCEGRSTQPATCD